MGLDILGERIFRRFFSARQNRLPLIEGIDRHGAAVQPRILSGSRARLSARQGLMLLLALALLVRLLTLGAYPLADMTEARYGEIARKMLETGQWIVPQIDYGVPFWGKPPLSIWLTAISYGLFGINEFAARLPALLLSIAACALVYLLADRQRGEDFALRTCVVLATTMLTMVDAGAVMTDPSMFFGTTLSMVAFWLAYRSGSRVWGYLFFLGLAVGLLAKGPVALVLSLAPVIGWTVLTGRSRQVWQSLPWIGGSVLTAALTVPWYWAAEMQSPGFLHYFLVGEHWQRFTVTGWKGDLYGSGHAHARGTIWFYLFAAALPWSPWALWQVLRKHRSAFGIAELRAALRTVREPASSAPSSVSADDGWLVYLWCWMLAPVVFFTLARNILPTYVLPGLAGFALLAAGMWHSAAPGDAKNRVAWLGVLAPAVFAGIVWLYWPTAGIQSQKELIATYQNLGSPQKPMPLLYLNRRPYSAEFYSHGQAKKIVGDTELRAFLARRTEAYFVAQRRLFDGLPPDIRAHLQPVAASRIGSHVLLRTRYDDRVVRISPRPGHSAGSGSRGQPGDLALQPAGAVTK